MPPRQAQPAKSTAEAAADEVRMQEALAAVRASGLTASGRPVFSLRAAAKHHDVPPTTLTGRYQGKTTRKESHEDQQKLTPAQELILVEWIKVMGVRGVPLSMTAVAEYASAIVDEDVSVNWARKFRTRHPDLKARWTTGLESCRARCLNRALVSEYFNILEELIETYSIPPENIYNMDEKGIQLGVGARTMVLVDRDQRTVYHVEDGNRELVTVIETTCADGTALRPSVIYKGKTRDLEWGRNNPCNASISVSPKGWTDNELGSMWLEKDFEPETAARNISNGWRLLILDGHNSHCTYRFCYIAEVHKIIILCLVAHTTHRCQPNDVGVFGPLASAWKSQVNQLSRKFKKITKYNLLQFYHAAREKVFTTSTIQAAFRKTGIHPFNRDIIEDAAFEPAKNTTTQSAQPVAARLPALLEPTPTPIASSSVGDRVSDIPTRLNPSSISPSTPAAASSSTASYSLISFPTLLPSSASRAALLQNNLELTSYAYKCKEQMAGDYASMRLMDTENGSLRAELFAKKSKPAKQRVGGAGARHMTSEETLAALAYIDWKASIALVHAEFLASDRVMARRTVCDDSAREVVDGLKRAEKAVVDAQKAVERETKKAEADAERARKKAVVDAERAEKKVAAAAVALEKKRVLEAEKAVKVAETKRKKDEKEAEKKAKALEKERKKGEKPAVASKGRGTKRKRTEETHLENDENAHPGFAYTPDTPPALKRPRPNPKPAYRNANVAAGGAMQDPVLLAPIVPVLQVLTNYVPVIDPRLLADSYL